MLIVLKGQSPTWTHSKWHIDTEQLNKYENGTQKWLRAAKACLGYAELFSKQHESVWPIKQSNPVQYKCQAYVNYTRLEMQVFDKVRQRY